MRIEDLDARWNTLSDEVLTGMKDWRVQHPTAPFREIEAALGERLARLRARMLEDALFITADPALGALVTAQHVATFKALLPQVQIAPIAGAGHSVRRDQFQRYMAVLEPFLTEVMHHA